ncbi:MAG: menaquinol oxidoreductase [Thermodesulfatator sp.]|nr:MAG: menaquinol oxidoreductase [Thermodesulfatator sp.]
MNVAAALIAVIGMVLVVWLGVGVLKLYTLFGVVIPYAAFLIFVLGLIWRMVNWAKSPVPFKITTTCGQQKSLSWIKHSRLESPANNFEVVLRMALEVLAFRSLFRNLRADLRGRRLYLGSSKWLWLGAILFHWSFLIILVRHMRLFSYPVPGFIQTLNAVDSFFHIGLPHLYLTDVTILAGLTFLLLRRLVDAKVNYISLASDYFPLFLILGLVISGMLMRYFLRVDIASVKELTLGLATLHPKVPKGIGLIFYVHIFFVSMLAAYFPFSKLVHMVGVFFSPTRNLPNDNRRVRHINPWWEGVPPKFLTYCEWQEKFKDKLIDSGQPIDEDCYKEKKS